MEVEPRDTIWIRDYGAQDGSGSSFRLGSLAGRRPILALRNWTFIAECGRLGGKAAKPGLQSVSEESAFKD